MRCLLSIVAIGASTVTQAQHNLEDAKKDWPDLRILEPREIRGLSEPIRADLDRRGCKIPMFTRWDGVHNAIRGQFARAGQQDVAVLCLKDDDMSIVVYWGAAADQAEELRKFPADAYRMIHTVSAFVLKRRAIRDQAVDRLPAFDHDGIDDGPVGGHADTVYYHEGGWLQVF